MPDSVRIWGPGSLSNLGPGFDTLGIAIEGVGDVHVQPRGAEPELDQLTPPDVKVGKVEHKSVVEDENPPVPEEGEQAD